MKRAFPCSWAGCQRSFGKAEHLQRHERSHTGDARYECPFCQKRFGRRDVMTRHAALHGEASGSVKKPRKVSCAPCVASKVRCDGQSGAPCRRCLKSGRLCSYRTRESAQSSDMGMAFSTTGNGSGLSQAPDDSEISSDLRHRQDSVADIDISQPSFLSSLDGDISGTMPAQPSDEFEPPFSFSPLYDPSIESFEGFLGWDLGDEDSDLMRNLNGASPDTPPACWPPFATSTLATRSVEQLESEPQAAAAAQLIRDAQPADSPWPHVYRPSKEDGQLRIPQLNASSMFQPGLHGAYLDHVNNSTREAIITLISAAHQPHWTPVDVAAFPSARTLSTCINLYFGHFHETLPIIRRSTFRSTEASPVLLLSMAAIGATYSKNGLAGTSVALNELSRRTIAHLRESDRRAMFDTSTVQAWLLQSVFGLFCGSRMLYQHSEISRGGLVTAARRMHLLRPGFSFVKELERHRATASPEEVERACAKDEERCRLGWGIYLYDMQISALLNISPHFSISEIHMSLPCDEEAWESSRSFGHLDSGQSQGDALNFRHMLERLLSVGKLPQPLKPFGLSIIAYTLYRLCTDVSSLDVICPAQPTGNGSLYRLNFPANVKHNPQEILDQLSVCLHFLSYTPTALLVNVSALSHLGHMQFTWSGFLDKVKIAAGKSGTEESKLNARAWLSSRISDDVIGARSILVHAGQLNALLIRFTFENPCEAIWIFYAALALWAITKFGTGLNIASSGSKRTVVTWSDFDDVDEWIQHGGQASFQGLGNLADLSEPKLLSTFSERLESMSWGIAVQFRHVLMNLSKEIIG